MSRRALPIFVLLTAFFAGFDPPGLARAEDPSPGEMALARQEFVAGVESARVGTWPEALAHFERSFALYAYPETLFNIASAQRQLGRLVAATESYRRYLRFDVSRTDAENRVRAERALSELAPALPVVTLHVAGVSEGDRLLLDGAPIHRAALAADLPVDPGAHVLSVDRGGNQVLRREFRLEAGEHLELAEALPAAKVPSAEETARRSLGKDTSTPRPPEHDDRSTRKRRIILWTVAGVVLAGAGAAVGLSYALRDKSEPTHGSFGGDVTLR